MHIKKPISFFSRFTFQPITRLVFWLVIVLLPLALILPSLFFLLTKETPSPFFALHPFTSYTENLQAFCLSTQKNLAQSSTNEDPASIKPWIEEILAFKPSTKEANQAFYQNTLTNLRGLIASGKEPFFAQHFIEWIYFSNPIWDALISDTHVSKQESTLSPISLKDALNELQEAFKKQQRYSTSLLPHFFEKLVKKSGSDMALIGNLPFPLFTIQKNQTQVIRTASPIIKSPEGNYTVSQEFSHFLNNNTKQKKSHLYVNLMKMRKEEKPETELLHTQETIYPGLMVITLDACSPFYWQRDPYNNLNNAIKFKETFMKHMLSMSEGYRWSSKLHVDAWKGSLEKILDQVHIQFFQNKESLSIKERQAFIQIAQLEMVSSLRKQHKFDSLNVSCQHTLDRGGTFLGLLFYLEAADSKGTLSQKDLNRWITLMVNLPPLLHRRLAHEKRLERATLTLKTLYLL